MATAKTCTDNASVKRSHNVYDIYMSIWLIFPLLIPLQINSIHARRKRVFKICKSMSAILAIETQTETETPILRLRLRLRLAVRYLWDTRARRELSNAISRPAGSSFWRLSLLTLRRRRRVSFGVWKSRQFHLSRAKNETYPTDTQYDAASTKIQ